MNVLGKIKNSATARYIFPFIVFMALTECQRLGNAETIFWIYGAKVILTSAALWFCFKDHLHEIKGDFDWKAVLLGLVVLIIWVLPSDALNTEKAVSFNPSVFDSAFLKICAVFFRVAGAVLIVPVLEELIWRSFLMRYLIKPNFLSVPLGSYAPLAFWGTVIAFTLVHRPWEWPMTVVTGILYGGYLVKTKNLKGCMIAHGVTNLGLAVYVLLTKNWFLW